tara:strand:+ start:59338 stop:59709 length:372 start_codon:yes stop_codon:yes gene_type:complete
MAEYEDVEIIEDESPSERSIYLENHAQRLVSGVLGLMGFFVCALVGLLAGNPGAVILVRAMIAMVICSLIGRVLGAVGEICVQEFVSRYKTERPEPQKPQELVELDERKQAHESMVQTMKKAA